MYLSKSTENHIYTQGKFWTENYKKDGAQNTGRTKKG